MSQFTDNLRKWAFRTLCSLGGLTDLRDPARWLINWAGGAATASGVHVNENLAMNLVGVGACVQILADTVSTLPLLTYRDLSPGRERAKNRPIYSLLHDQPNEEMTSSTFRSALQVHLSLWGNAYAEIQRDGANRVVALWPRDPAKTMPTRTAGRLVFETTDTRDGRRLEIDPPDMVHIPGLSMDGLVGKSPIRMYREAVGLGMALERYGGKFFANGGHVHLWAKHPRSLTEKSFKNLRETLRELYSGLDNVNKIAVMEEGMELHTLGMPHDDAQFLESRKFQLAEFARMYRIPLHLLDETDKAATYASVEQFAIMFVVHTVRPILVKWEQELNRKLMPADGSLFCEFLVDGLLRGDQKSRYDAYAIGRQWGWLSANDICRAENLNPVPGGDEYLVPLNMAGARPAATPTKGG